MVVWKFPIEARATKVVGLHLKYGSSWAASFHLPDYYPFPCPFYPRMCQITILIIEDFTPTVEGKAPMEMIM
jgi:hypothetical protein